MEVHRHPLPYEDQRARDAQWQKHPQHGTGDVTPKIAKHAATVGGNAANEGNSDSETRSSREKVLRRQRDNLAEITHRRLAAVGLPGGRRGKANCSINCKIIRHWSR